MRTTVAAAIFVSVASAAANSFEIRSISLSHQLGLDKRQTCTVDEITPTSCQECFGTGSVNCLSNTCYNPGNGDSCCSNGRYCLIGTYCTNAGCCPNGSSLEQCGATVSLSVVPPPSSGATSSTSSTSSASPTTSIQTQSTAPAVVSDMTSVLTTPTSASISIASFTGAASPNIVPGGRGLIYALVMFFGNFV